MRKTSALSRALVLTVIALSLLATTIHAQVSSAEAQVLSARYLAAGIGFGLAALGAGIGIGIAGAASISALIERRDLFALYLMFVALAEAIAIYGFVIFFILY
ncbi:ATPase [Vulcanisaeta thermophila]|uniref:ATPase n=1 Tax=Vulcanisaeta thermophila TaxID=867917 RepID=UPI000853B807|nr:ATPase [Vulcanisaeta thermophila]